MFSEMFSRFDPPTSRISRSIIKVLIRVLVRIKLDQGNVDPPPWRSIAVDLVQVVGCAQQMQHHSVMIETGGWEGVGGIELPPSGPLC